MEFQASLSTRFAVTFLTILARFLIGPPSRVHPFTILLIISLLYPGVSLSRFVVGRILFLLMLFMDIR
ncbi:hypothetical protein [Alicyclobacillus macrosporangiidus]|uniref:Uncharacterized protein n=1 Tax=Alicyclobacillus macrosporangiidus TaxID=392015 RepID=A0A1I7L0K2_9BACL|nr:hypothetical protein [Alicyclobacillus macrosporangiidus]SFV03292.1 hypothetical protein SAMN05421543_12247 [Alicyclobacillus macrosporangiidus]